VWFSSIYILLMISLVGCPPRTRVYYAHAARLPKVPQSRAAARVPVVRIDVPPASALSAARRRGRRYRVDVRG
jgi:cytochrome c biogenesis protein ResB